MVCRILITAVAMGVASGCSSRPSNKPDQGPHVSNVATDSQWNGQSVGRAEELLAGRFPGVEVYRVQGGIGVRIRGGTSVNGSNEPLYVVDGMTIEPGPGGALVGINPADIEKIEVLKDAGSTAQWGVRGANGVIVIKTKRGPSK
jgi:TonB-dependent SusC/RagA subfamily outer membrane receptor